jgi:hypothetical protein
MRFLLFLFVFMCGAHAAPPGIVVDHSPASSGLYIGSPSIVILPNGHYLASHDFFGPKSAEFEAPTSAVFDSADRGESWKKIATLNALFWAGLFVHRDAVYLMGTDKHHGRVVIRRSVDGGHSWTDAVDPTHGLLTARANYHTAPTPVVEHAGRLWRAFEDASGGEQWGTRYLPIMLSIPANADLLNATNWTFSEPITRDTTWPFSAWLEGNALVTPDNQLASVLRLEVPAFPEKAAIVSVSPDGKALHFDSARDMVSFPGGAKKFTIRFDQASASYWTLTSATPAEFQKGKPNPIRNTLALLKSKDLRTWAWRATLLQHADFKSHGFQYADWQFDGPDIVAVVRTAFDDDEGGAHNFHDANFLTFHRFQGFRELR